MLVLTLRFLLILLTLPCLTIYAQGKPADTAPNIVFILADDLGYGDLGCYGVEDIRTPHLDKLAADGIRFTDFYANGAVCSPTRVAFLTGRYQQRVGMDNALYYQEMGRGLPIHGATIADALRSAGYATGVSGKWHVGYDHQRQPLQQGFDHFFGLLGGNHHYFEHMDRIGVPDLWLGNEPIRRAGYTTDLITEDAVAFIKRSQQRPFFLYLSHAAPHFPWQGPDDADKVVRPKQKSWQQGDRATYAAMVENMDSGIGRVLKTLDDLGLRDKTLVVFTSDNGGHTYSRNAPLRGSKSQIWDGGTRVPCIARWPGVLPAGKTTGQVGITMDWTATFRRLAGLETNPDGEDGLDLMPMLTGDRPTSERTLFWRRKKGPVRKQVEEGRAVRRGQWKFVEQAADGERFLFDLETDPSEATNLIAKQPEIARALHKQLDAWEASVDPRADLRVATFQCDVTPPIGHWLYAHPLKTVEHPLLAKGLVLEQAGTRYVLCAIDWCVLSNGSHTCFRRSMAEAAGTDLANATIQCTRVHISQ
jgi:N-acetylgalactosamine-6-sulfatase